MPKSNLTDEQRYANQLEASRRWKERNKEKVKAYQKEWDASNKDLKKKLKAAWDKKNTEYRKQYNKEWVNKNPLYFRDKHLKAEYGLTLEDYNALKESQGNKCLGCGIEEEKTKRGVLVVDHCHSTGRVRGLLCSECNSALGMVKDNKQTLQNLINYLGE